MATKALDIILGVRSNLSTGLAKANDDVKKWASGIQGQLGRGSAIDEIGDMFQGRGPIKGFVQALQIVRDTTTAIREALTAVRTGQMSWSEAIDETIRKVPILGDAYQATRDIVEIITGEAAERTKNLSLMERELALSKGQLAAAKRVAAEWGNINKVRADALKNLAMNSLTGTARERMGIDLDEAGKIRGVQKDTEEALALEKAENRRVAIVRDAERAIETIRRNASEQRKRIAEEEAKDATEQRNRDRQQANERFIDSIREASQRDREVRGLVGRIANEAGRRAAVGRFGSLDRPYIPLVDPGEAVTSRNLGLRYAAQQMGRMGDVQKEKDAVRYARDVAADTKKMLSRQEQFFNAIGNPAAFKAILDAALANLGEDL